MAFEKWQSKAAQKVAQQSKLTEETLEERLLSSLVGLRVRLVEELENTQIAIFAAKDAPKTPTSKQTKKALKQQAVQIDAELKDVLSEIKELNTAARMPLPVYIHMGMDAEAVSGTKAEAADSTHTEAATGTVVEAAEGTGAEEVDGTNAEAANGTDPEETDAEAATGTTTTRNQKQLENVEQGDAIESLRQPASQ